MLVVHNLSQHLSLQFEAAIPSLEGVRLALDCVGGKSALNLASSLAEGGSLVVYGTIAGNNLELPARDFVFKDIHIRGGFHVYKWTANPANREVSTHCYQCYKKTTL